MVSATQMWRVAGFPYFTITVHVMFQIGIAKSTEFFEKIALFQKPRVSWGNFLTLTGLLRATVHQGKHYNYTSTCNTC